MKKLLSVISLFMLLCGVGVSAQTTVSVEQNLGTISSARNGEIIVPLHMDGTGGAQIESLGVTVSLNGIDKQYVVKPELLAEGTYAVKLPSPSATGVYDMSLNVDKVNGMDNDAEARTMAGRLINLSRTVDHKVVFEEFTGLGCGWCPRGLVALEEARQVYGRNIVLISAHFDDPLSCRDYNLLRQNQLPSAHLDRYYESIDPYFGTSGGGEVFGINNDIKKCAAVAPVAEVKVSASVDGDVLTATSDVKFLFSGSGDYAVAFVLTEDGVCNEKWSQLNNYYQVKGMGFVEEKDPLFEKWINGENHVKGVVYDDVAISAQGVKNGIDGSIPASFVEEESNIYEVEFNLAKLKKIQNRKNLNVCAFLYDRKKDVIINADYMSFEHETAIEGVEADDENVVEAARYTIDGRLINTPEKGINIVKYSDGSVRKVVVR